MAGIPPSLGQDLAGCVPQAAVLCPLPALSLTQRSTFPRLCQRGTKTRKRTCRAVPRLCPTGPVRKYLRKLLAGLGRGVRAAVSVLIALPWPCHVLVHPGASRAGSSLLRASCATRSWHLHLQSSDVLLALHPHCSSLSPAAGQTPCQRSPCHLDSQQDLGAARIALLLKHPSQHCFQERRPEERS